MTTVRPKVGISACVLGERVRYNGAGAPNEWVREELGQHVDYLSICPEVAMGLGVPREAMRLLKSAENGVQLVTSRGRQDMSAVAAATVFRLLASLPEDLDGYVLMGRSPLCGPERVKLYADNGIPAHEGVGLFAAALAAARPELVVVEAGRLTDPRQRERFILRLFTQARARAIEPRPSALQEFHRRHKFLLMAQGRTHLETLGRIVADARKPRIEEALAAYRKGLFNAMSGVTKRTTMVDAMTHMYGFMKDELGEAEKLALRRRIEEYRLGRATLPVPMALLEFCNQIARSAYVGEQAIFAPYPEMRIGDER